MGHKCFISFKKEDEFYRQRVIQLLGRVDSIDKSLDREIKSDDGDYIMQAIRNEYLHDSTVTIFLIGEHSSENEGKSDEGRDKNYFIKRELQASLFNGQNNTRNGILGIVLPNMETAIFKGSYKCNKCHMTHEWVDINDDTVIREFSVNYYCEPHEGCGWRYEDRYCVLVRWSDFEKDPQKYIEMAYQKRKADVVEKIKIKNLR